MSNAVGDPVLFVFTLHLKTLIFSSAAFDETLVLAVLPIAAGPLRLSGCPAVQQTVNVCVCA